LASLSGLALEPGAGRRRREGSVHALWNARTAMLAPSLAAFAAFFALPLVYLLVVSFWRLRLYKLEPAFTLKNYGVTLVDYGDTILTTFAITAAISVIVTVLAYAFAYALRFKAGRWADLYLFITLVTLFGGYLVKIYAWKTILGSEGLLNSALMALGLVAAPVAWLLYSPVAVIVTLVHFLLPFAILPIYGSLRGVATDHVEAARDLGARPRQAFLHVVLPQTQAGLIAAFAMTFLYSAGDYVTPRLVGGPNIAMIGNFIESQFIQRLNAPQGAAMGVTVMAVCSLFVLGVALVTRRVLAPR
jgi:spermidine/putrescine transport system permease protein